MPAALSPEFAALLQSPGGASAPTSAANAAAPRGNSPNFLSALRTYDQSGDSKAAAPSDFLAALAKAPPPASTKLDPEFAALAADQNSGSAPAGTGRLPLQIGPWNTGLTMPAGLSDVAAGAGKTLTDWGLGAEQMGARVGAKLDPSRYGRVPAQLAQQAAQKRALDAPLMNTWGGKIGAMAPSVGAAFIPGLDGLAGLTALGAAQGALTPTAPGDSRVLNTAVGGALGAGGKFLGDAAGGWLARRVGAALRPALTDAQKAALEQGESLGMRVTPGQRAGSKPLQQVETWAQSHPWTSGPFARVSRGNQQALDRAAAQSIGEDADTVDSTVLGRANDRLADTFEQVRNPNHTILFDPEGTKAALDGIDQEFKGLLPNGMDIRGNALVQQLDELSSRGHVTAQQLGQLSSKLGRAAYKQMTSPSGDRDLGQASSP